MAGSPVVSTIWHGLTEFNTVTREIEARTEIATITAIKANQNKLKTAIRANLRGAPRWTQKGANRITGKNYQVPGTTGQHNSPRGGGPGRMTGVLYKGVGGVRNPKKDAAGFFIGGVGVGAKPNRVKKAPLELKFPYFRPAYEKTLPIMGDAFDAGWDKAISRVGGII